MAGSCNDESERLYLEKHPTGDISVPCSELAQHQIEGVRFLYSQYKKEKCGVILNYPSGCGSSVQTVIFISVICDMLKRPALILYDTDQEKKAWLARFARWTSIHENSIEVDVSNPYAKKQIFINSVANIAKFHIRSWSIVVVKSDIFIQTFKKYKLKADYKIWITAQDLTRNRELLNSIYTWINPLDKLLKEYLSGDSPAMIPEATSNEILLDLLLEDYLITRKGLMPFGTPKRRHDPEIPVQTVSKKNKDVTGKKIKRSKKYHESPTASSIRIENVVSIRDIDHLLESAKESSVKTNIDEVSHNYTNDDRTDNDDEETKMDVESFIRDNDPLKSDIGLSFAINNLDSISHLSEPSSPAEEEACAENSLNFASAIADIIRIENQEPKETCEDSISFIKECDLIQNVTSNESADFNKIDISIPVIENTYSNFGFDSDEDSAEEKIEKESSDGDKIGNGVADQTSKLDVSSSVMKETDSFDSKVKEFEERALRKFKGSVLDTLF